MLVPTTGGQPKRISENFNPANAFLTWSPDGSHVLGTGRIDSKGPPTEPADWFAVSVRDGTVVRTGAAAALRSQKVLPETDNIPGPSDWTGGSVLFTVRNGDANNVWRVAVNPATFQLDGPAERLTSGTSQETSPTMSRDGKLAFAAVDTLEDYWALPIDANAASVTGPRTPLMKNSASDRFALSLDGNTLVYCTHRGGQTEIRSRDLRTGKETLLVSAATAQHIGSVSADANTFLYTGRGEQETTFIGTTSGGPPREVCQGCTSTTLAKDGSKVLFNLIPDYHTYYLMDIASGRRTALVSSATRQMNGAQFSPDDQWAAIRTLQGELLLVPVRDSKVDEKEVIVIGRGTPLGGYQRPIFSPDGNTIYYLSDEDSHTCIYAQRLSANKQPAGAPVVVQHLHETNRWGHPHGVRVGADKIVLLMNQGTSNIWLMAPRP